MVVDDEPMAREILETYISKTPHVELLESYDNALDALQFIKENSVDLLFLDINMPEINGLGLAKLVDGKIPIVFTTAYREYAIEGFQVEAIDYLLKPFSFARFLQSVQRAQKQYSKVKNTQERAYIFVRSDRKMIKVNLKDIKWLESSGDYIKFYTSTQMISTRETIQNIEQILPKSQFLRTHRSFIVQISRIDAYTHEHIEIDETIIPIGRSYKEGVLSCLGN
jgi:DNA-binding LytR/AlgR family response regulator